MSPSKKQTGRTVGGAVGYGTHARQHEIPHLWHGERCARCAMHREWPGARYSCEGYAANRYGALTVAQRERKRELERQRRQREKLDPERAAIRREQVRRAVAKRRARLRTEISRELSPLDGAAHDGERR